ncbi:MAG: aldo/keto reductase [Kiritimatiellae bacterium]|nr:aldo/keto reductase [Kiritimatiellia bacterium]
MKYAEVTGVGKPVSRIVLGTMIVNMREKARSFALLDAAYETGINAFDTAHGYAGGQSEQALGEWMKERGVREEVVILTKGCHPNKDGNRVTPEALAADLAESLARLQTPYIDLYTLHRDDPQVPVAPIVDALNAHFEAGRIRAFGGSNWRHERIREANRYAAERGLVPFRLSSPNFGLAEQVENPWGPGCVSLSGPRNAGAREWYEAEQMPVFAYSSLGRGLFSGRVTRENCATTCDGACRKAYCHEVNFRRLDRVRELAQAKGVSVAQLALAYVFSQPLNAFALVGAASREECAANAAALDVALTPAECAWVDLRRGERPG